MIVISIVILAFVMNLMFIANESRNTFWKEGKFWVVLVSLSIVLGTVIYGY